tara:strand:+ start:8315 stop:9571 length:1257 start_codon:yes stop_codon:yes gene_type:complete
MNIAVIISNPNQSGGAFQYELLNLTILKNYKNQDLNYIYYSKSKKIIKYYKSYNINIKLIKKNLFHIIFDFFLSISLFNKILINISNISKRPKLKLINKFNLTFNFSLENNLKKDNIDLVYFASPSLLFREIRNLPFIFTLFDLNFHSHNQYPELSKNNEFLKRYNFYFEALNRAFKIIVCSQYLKNQVKQYYNIFTDRIEILPYLPNKFQLNSDSEIFFKEKYSLDCNYIFYPATFYAHKNHLYILKVLDFINNFYGKNFYVYFVGSNPGLHSTFDFLKKTCSRLALEKNVKFFNFVEDDSIQYFYKNAVCLLMPSFNGPNNIPPLEAIINKCPVFYSDIPEFQEQFGNLVEYIDLNSPKSTAKKIINLFDDLLYRKNRVNTQLKFFNNWNDKKFSDKLSNIFLDYKKTSENWKYYD